MATTNFRIGSIGIYTDYESAKADIANKNDANNAFLKRFSTYTCRNAFNYASDPFRGSDFALINDEETIEAKYIPTVSFTFNAITPEVYSWFIQVVNTRKFFVRYYDYEIQRDVIRKMYMSEKDLERVQFGSPNSWDIDDEDTSTKNQYGYILRLIGLSVTFVSHYGYDSYEDMIAKAEEDERFFEQLSVPRYEIPKYNVLTTYDASGNTISVYDANGNSLFVTDAGDDKDDPFMQITPYNANGTAISVYKKDGDALTKIDKVYYPYMLIKHELDVADDYVNVYYTDDGSEPLTTLERELMPIVNGKRKIQLYNYTSKGKISFKFRANKDGYADSYIVTYTWG